MSAVSVDEVPAIFVLLDIVSSAEHSSQHAIRILAQSFQ